MAPVPSHLTPSELGTKEYWETTYATDLTTHTTDPTHTGTVWFSDSAAEEKVLQFLDEQVDSTSSCLGQPLDKQTTTFLDVGTGNGRMLFALREEGWGGEIVGVDYSEKSVELARRVGEEMGYGARRGRDEQEGGTGPGVGEGERDGESGNKEVKFDVADIMASPPPSPSHTPWLPPAGFDVVLDKGTFDAISLSSDLDARGRRICEGYRGRVERLVRRGGILLVTSCNWTEEELTTWFVVPEGGLEAVGRIRYPVFRFGGGVGQSVSCVCFRRREEQDSAVRMA